MSPRSKQINLAGATDKLLLRLFSLRIAEVLLLCTCAGLFFMNAFRYRFPVGYAGLYALMSENLAANHFALPWSVLYYGPGGIPFAYPPVGFYLAAIFIKLGVPTFDYLRLAPPLFAICSLIAIYLLILRLTASRVKALIGATLAATASLTYDLHVPAAGMVRAPALLFATLSLIFAWDAFSSQEPPKRNIVRALLAAVFLALTTMTHLSYAAFAILGIISFALCGEEKPWRQRLVLGAAILGGGALLSAPWWGTLLARYGFSIFSGALQSHSNLGILSTFQKDGWRAPYTLLKHLTAFNSDWEPAQLVGLETIGLIYLALRRRWLIPGWFLALFLLVGESSRFLALVSCIAAAELVGDLLAFAQSREDPKREGHWAFYLVFTALLFAFPFRAAWKNITADSPILSEPMLDTADWLRTRTPSDAGYLYLGGNSDFLEWMPYLSARAPLVGGWGAEWIGTYNAQVAIGEQLGACLAQQSFGCYRTVMEENDLSPSYLLSMTGWPVLNESIATGEDWQKVFANDLFVVFGRR